MNNINEEYNINLAGILESVEDAIICKSLDGSILSWNKGSEKMFGYTANEIIGMPVATLIPDDRTGEEIEILEQVIGKLITKFNVPVLFKSIIKHHS